jgi:hypothetical protein
MKKNALAEPRPADILYPGTVTVMYEPAVFWGQSGPVQV